MKEVGSQQNCCHLHVGQSSDTAKQRPQDYKTGTLNSIDCSKLTTQPYSTGNKPPLKVIVSKSHDPFFNLAAEDHLFEDVALDASILFLWRNKPTVVIGKWVQSICAL